MGGSVWREIEVLVSFPEYENFDITLYFSRQTLDGVNGNSLDLFSNGFEILQLHVQYCRD